MRPKHPGLAYIRNAYAVPAFMDYPVVWRGQPGTISGVSGPHVMVTLETGKRAGPIHPTDEDLRYLVPFTAREA